MAQIRGSITPYLGSSVCMPVSLNLLSAMIRLFVKVLERERDGKGSGEWQEDGGATIVWYRYHHNEAGLRRSTCNLELHHGADLSSCQ